MAKSLNKSLILASKQKDCQDLSAWIRSVGNHFWWSADTCNGNVQQLKVPILLIETKLLKMRSTRLEFLLELVNDAYLTANRTRYVLSSKQDTTPLDHASPTTTRSQAQSQLESGASHFKQFGFY